MHATQQGTLSMKRALLAATAILSSSFMSVPAYAGPNDDIPLPSVQDTSGLTPDQVCQEILRPNDPNSQFQTDAINETDNVVLSSTLVTDTTWWQQVPTGTPTYSNYGNFDATYHHNGQRNIMNPEVNFSECCFCCVWKSNINETSNSQSKPT